MTFFSKSSDTEGKNKKSRKKVLLLKTKYCARSYRCFSKKTLKGKQETGGRVTGAGGGGVRGKLYARNKNCSTVRIVKKRSFPFYLNSSVIVKIVEIKQRIRRNKKFPIDIAIFNLETSYE